MPDVGDWEGRIVAAVDVVFENTPPDPSAALEFVSEIHLTTGSEYSAVRVHDSLLDLFNSGLVASARVEVTPENANDPKGPIRVRFVIRRQVRVGAVRVEIVGLPSSAISVDEIRSRLNMLQPGSPASEQTLKSNADLIQAYMRDRGFFKAEVDYSQQPDPNDTTGTRVIVIFHVKPNEQARVSSFTINVAGFNASSVQPTLRLQPGSPFSRAALGEDLNRIRQAIIAQGYLAPELDDPRTTLDPGGTSIALSVTGAIGPKVEVTVKNYELSEKLAKELLPVKREGTIDQSAIVEGGRRLRNKLQEEGYFFADVPAVCTVTPPTEATVTNGTAETCENLNPSDLNGRTVNITYDVEQGRRFKLTDIRIEGTDKIAYADVENDLRTQKTSAFSFVPLLGGYGRGYTSRDLLEQDRRMITSRMRDLGYRKANVDVRQGVTVNGDSLIITFVVDEGPLTRVAGIAVRGNKMFTVQRLQDEIAKAGKTRCHARPANDFTACFQTAEGSPYSASQSRKDGDAILNLYAKNGYLDAQMDFATVDLPEKNGEEQVRVVYTLRNEGDKVFIDEIIINGLVLTKEQAIRRIIPLKPGEVLRADRISESERILYSTDAFRQVIIRTEPAGETASGFKQRDVIIDVEEQKPHILNYGGGFSTDFGPLGTIDLRNVNLFGQLRQGAFRIRASGLQQLARIEYIDPRFRPYGANQFSPLVLSLQYQRDSTVTRFFRSAIDRGTNGIVQRLDQNGNPIDEFGNSVKQPTINRFTFNAETQRLLDEKTRTNLFLRYSYEDVRLFNIGSLLIADILRPDQAVRISRLGATFVRDTRDSQFNTTRGDFFTADYSLALRQLGGNISFNKLQLNYRKFYMLEKLRRTVLAGNITLGMANLFNPRDRDGIPGIDAADLTLPISERFFAGGATDLRGFGYEEAGPRQAEPDCTGLSISKCFQMFGPFRNSKGELVQVDPFTVPIGGNAKAIVNLEARIPLTKIFQVVPFYDGGNVFRSVGELFGKQDLTIPANLRAHWTNTVGVGIGFKTPLGSTLSIDYGFLLNPPTFEIPQANGDTAFYKLKSGRIHFRFTTAF
jgi:outer membrane protein insertion porin family